MLKILQLVGLLIVVGCGVAWLVSQPADGMTFRAAGQLWTVTESGLLITCWALAGLGVFMIALGVDLWKRA